MRLRIIFSKTEAMRYTGHLDLYRTWERTLRRANLPLAYSQGFKPHPRLTLASALPLGFTSQAEVMDVWLENNLPIDQVERALLRALPPGLQVEQISQVETQAPGLQARLVAAEYLVTLNQPYSDLDARLEKVLSVASLPRERRGKPYDLRPLILDLQRQTDDPEGCQRILMRLSAQEGATGRPEEVLLCANIDPLAACIHRTGLIFVD